jgi:hypothetical protein
MIFKYLNKLRPDCHQYSCKLQVDILLIIRPRDSQLQSGNKSLTPSIINPLSPTIIFPQTPKGSLNLIDVN